MLVLCLLASQHSPNPTMFKPSFKAILINLVLIGSSFIVTAEQPEHPSIVHTEESAQNSLGLVARDIECDKKHPKDGHDIKVAVEIVEVKAKGTLFKHIIQAGDLLISINGQTINTCSDITPALSNQQQHGAVSAELLRGDELISLGTMKQARKDAHQFREVDDFIKENSSSRFVNLSREKKLLITTYVNIIKSQLAAAPDGTDQQMIIDSMLKIRQVFNEYEANGDNSKTALRDASIQLKKEQYSIVLSLKQKNLTLQIYSSSGEILFNAPITSAAERQQIPPQFLCLLRKLQPK